MTLHSRQKRINEELRTHVAEIIRDELRDPRLQIGLITVTGVESSKDLRTATVHTSVLALDVDANRAIEALNHSAGLVRRMLGERMVIRYVPAIHFKLDGTARQAARISAILERVLPPDSQEPKPTVLDMNVDKSSADTP
jgi:ribosome-binding factor A